MSRVNFQVKYRKHFVVVPSDTTKFHKPITIYVGVTGDVAVVDWQSGATVTYKNFPQGNTLPILVERVMATGTLATNMVGMY